MEDTEPKNLYTIDEFRIKLENITQNIKGILNKWLIEDEYEFNILIHDTFGGGFTPRQFEKMIIDFYEEFYKLVNKEYINWSSKTGGDLYEILDREIDKLRKENELISFSAIKLVEHLINIVQKNLHEGEESMIYCLIKV
jgi:hypothetical protein